jgi:Tol biopolymer transport system component
LSRGRDLHAAVSRDGRLLAFAGMEFSFNAEAMPFDAETGRATSPPVQLTRGNSVTYFQSFSPDGDSIAYESRLGTTCHLWRVDRKRGGQPADRRSHIRGHIPAVEPRGRNYRVQPAACLRSGRHSGDLAG